MSIRILHNIISALLQTFNQLVTQEKDDLEM